ncbi:MAG: hypothetical protein CL860_05390 [Cyanobium sp. MED195]|nr:hypothetical protein [Cyanobium sp. MED195]
MIAINKNRACWICHRTIDTHLTGSKAKALIGKVHTTASNDQQEIVCQDVTDKGLKRAIITLRKQSYAQPLHEYKNNEAKLKSN